MEKFIYFLIPSIFILSGLYGLLKKEKKIPYIIILSFGLSIIAYYTLPNPEDDLERHFYVINSFKNQPFATIFYSGYSKVYLNNFIMYIIAQIGIPNLYTWLFTFIGYFILFKYILDVYKENGSKNLDYNLLFVSIFLFFMSFFKVYILAIRNYFCFIVGVYLINLYKHNKINIYTFCILNLMLALIHPISLIFFLYIVYMKIKNKYIKTIILISILLHKLILTFILSLLPTTNFFYQKISPYLKDALLAYNKNFMILYIIIILFTFIVIYYGHKRKQECDLLLLSTILAMSSFYQFDLIRRFIYLVPLFMCEPLLYILEGDLKIRNIPLKYICYFFMLCLSIGSILSMVANTNAYGWYFIF